MNAESEVFDLPVMVPGAFPVQPAEQISANIVSIEEELKIMDIELTELENINESITEELMNCVETCSNNEIDQIIGGIIDTEEREQDNKNTEQDIYMPEIDDELFLQGNDIEQEKPVEKPVKSFSCVIPGDKYKELFGSISILVTEARFHITHEGIKVSTVDTANVALVQIDYKTDNFSKYELTEPFDIGIDIVKFMKLKTLIKKDSVISINCSSDGSDKIVVDIDGTETRMTALNENTIRKDPHPPVIDLKQRIEFMAGDFIQGIKEGAKISDKVSLSLDNGAFMMSFEGDTDFQKKKVPISSWTPNVPAKRSLFSIDYLKDMVKVMDKKEKVVFYMDQDHPFKLVREHQGTEIMWMLAPRIEAD
jgi:proliferating cell nuclear antigen